MLRKRAEKVLNGNPSPNFLRQEFRLIPDWNFTCNGSITSVLLGVDLQDRSEYPEVQVWRRNSSVSSQFHKVVSKEITLVVGNFTPSGVFQYRLTPPIQFQNGDVLGVFQPSETGSLVRLYYDSNDDSAPVAYRLQHNPQTVNIATPFTGGLTTRSGEYILLTPITGIICLFILLLCKQISYKLSHVQILHVPVAFSALMI